MLFGELGTLSYGTTKVKPLLSWVILQAFVSLILLKLANNLSSQATSVSFSLASSPTAMDQNYCWWCFLCCYKYRGCRVIFRDKAGNYAGGFARKVSYATSPRWARSLQLEMVFAWPWSLNWQQVILECYALQVVQSLGNLHIWWLFHFWLKDIKTSLWSFVASMEFFCIKSLSYL